MVRATRTSTANSTSHTMYIVFDSSEGDLMIVHVVLDGNVSLTATPSGWTLIPGGALYGNSSAKDYLFYRIRGPGDDGVFVTFTSASSTRSSLTGISLVGGTFDPAQPITLEVSHAQTSTPTCPSATDPIGVGPKRVIALMGSDVGVTVSGWPLADNQRSQSSSATPGVTAALCTATSDAAIVPAPGYFTLPSSLWSRAYTLLIRGVS